MKKYFIIFFIFIELFINANEKNIDQTDDTLKKFNEEKLSYIAKKRFDEMSPLDVFDFYFYKGEKEISLEEFLSLTNDPLYYKNIEIIKKIKIGGFTTAGILGGCVIAFSIPSAILVANAVSYNLTTELKSNYLMSGVVSAILAIGSGIALIIDLIVTFSLIHKYENNENLYRVIIERYNNKLRDSLLLQPDLSIRDENLNLFLRFRI